VTIVHREIEEDQMEWKAVWLESYGQGYIGENGDYGKDRISGLTVFLQPNFIRDGISRNVLPIKQVVNE
jgi:hypothetical protein